MEDRMKLIIYLVAQAENAMCGPHIVNRSVPCEIVQSWLDSFRAAAQHNMQAIGGQSGEENSSESQAANA